MTTSAETEPVVLLNLGCGEKTSDQPGVVNIDWSAMLRLRSNALFRLAVPLVLRGERRERFDSLPDNILVHDLANGIPYPDASVDAVYHSHTLEHIDRDVAPAFLSEVRRVLRPGGVHRIVVPDLERLGRAYVDSLDARDSNGEIAGEHDSLVAGILEQSVRREAYGTSQQPPLRRWVENLLLGDARKRGHTHQWMYDRHNLTALLYQMEYQTVQVCDYRNSAIPDWTAYGLDADETGEEYRPGSLYIEARR